MGEEEKQAKISIPVKWPRKCANSGGHYRKYILFTILIVVSQYQI